MTDELPRDHLPIPDGPYSGPVFEDAKDRKRSSRRTSRRGRPPELDIAEAAEDLAHLISPEERLQIAMARQ
jgi:hypothetical protein